MQIPASSVEYVHVPVTTTARWAQPVEPTARMALVPSRTRPADEDWRPAFTDTDAAGRLTATRVRYLGDGAAGSVLDVWVEVTAGDEVVRALAGRLTLT